MKIGILTFHRAANFGTALQAAASLSALLEVGADAEFIDYRPEYIERTMRLMSLSDVRSFRRVLNYGAELVFRRRTKKKKIAGFTRFMRGFPSSEPIYDKEKLGEVCKKYDLIVSGSDQIWNPKISEGDMSYFLPFGHPRKAAFSSSFGTCDLPCELREEIASYLEDFGFISVREKSAAKYIREMIADGHGIVQPKEILDPTLLYGIDRWKEYAEPAKTPQGGYILAYYMLPTPLLLHATERLRRETGLPVVNIKPSKMDILKRNGVNAAAAGPGEFISILMGASYVVTNSFHGTAFSLNFEKPFISTPLPVKNGMDLNSRMVDVLSLAGLSERFTESESAVDALPLQVDFNDARARLDAARADSWKIVREMVEHF